MRKIYIESNGCAVLRHDTQRYSKYFRANGWTEVEVPADADMVLLTTCGVIQSTEDASMAALRRLKGEMKEGASLIVGGCLPKINPEIVSREFDGIVFGKEDEDKLDGIIGAEIGIANIFWDGDIFREHSLGDPELSYSDWQLRQLKLAEALSDRFGNGRYVEIYDYLTKGRFLWKEKGLFEVKVADGCNYNCSYCATKNAKGNLKSRIPEDILREFRLGVEKGYPKIILTGDEVGEYGRDIGLSLVELLDRMVPISGDSKIALRYISPEALIRQYRKLKKYFKIGKIYYFCSSFQSGSPRILRLMNRPDNIDTFHEIVKEIDRDCPYVYKQTQVIVGFPQETEEDLDKTMELIKDGSFDYVSVIKYSKRPYTKAIDMEGHISPEIIEARYRKVSELVASLRDKKLAQLTYEEMLKQFGQ